MHSSKQYLDHCLSHASPTNRREVAANDNPRTCRHRSPHGPTHRWYANDHSSRAAIIVTHTHTHKVRFLLSQFLHLFWWRPVFGSKSGSPGHIFDGEFESCLNSVGSASCATRQYHFLDQYWNSIRGKRMKSWTDIVFFYVFFAMFAKLKVFW